MICHAEDMRNLNFKETRQKHKMTTCANDMCSHTSRSCYLSPWKEDLTKGRKGTIYMCPKWRTSYMQGKHLCFWYNNDIRHAIFVAIVRGSIIVQTFSGVSISMQYAHCCLLPTLNNICMQKFIRLLMGGKSNVTHVSFLTILFYLLILEKRCNFHVGDKNVQLDHWNNRHTCKDT